MKRFLNVIHRLEDIIISLSLIFIVVMVCVNVALRYFFSTGLLWSDEIIGYVFVLLGMIGAAAAIRDDTNIYMDILIVKLPPRCKPYLYVTVQLMIAAVLVFFTAACLKLVISNVDVRSPMNRIPMWIPYAAMPVGMVMMLFELIVSFVYKATHRSLTWGAVDYEENKL